MLFNDHIVIVGAGLSGATLAERFANDGHRVAVFEKRDHIGGNTYDYVNEAGIRIAKYGAHIFHTSDEEVWQYVNRFSQFNDYKHRVLSYVNRKLVPVPVNIDTVNSLLGTNIKTPEEMSVWLQLNQVKTEIANSEDAALSRVGKDLYQLMFKPYTIKQWNLDPSELEPSVLQRIPVREDFNDRYFSDTYEGMPINGYTKMVSNMLNHPLIKVYLDVDWFKLNFRSKPKGIFFSGKIDQYFNHKHGKLEYRSLRFEHETFDIPNYQPASVVNYPSLLYPFTRIIEHKKFYNTRSNKTTITKEYSIDGGEPYYPVPNEKNRAIFEKYKSEANERKDVCFVGRLANYKYFNMDQAIKNALDIFQENRFNFIEGK